MASLYANSVAALTNTCEETPLAPYSDVNVREARLLLAHNIPIYSVSATLTITKITTEEQLANLAIEIMFDTESAAVEYLVEIVTSRYEQARHIVELHDKLKTQYPHYFL